SGTAVWGSSLHPVRIAEGNSTKQAIRSARNMIRSFQNREARLYFAARDATTFYKLSERSQYRAEEDDGCECNERPYDSDDDDIEIAIAVCCTANCQERYDGTIMRQA